MNTPMPFEPFPKMARFSREAVITEKIDGTNACIRIEQDGTFLTGSRTRWITPSDDNAGFSRWAHEHKEELMRLGPGTHFGEWWGRGIQRGYGLAEKRFSLFNVYRWADGGKDGASRPSCCSVVPVLWQGPFDQIQGAIEQQIHNLSIGGSSAAPGFMDPEGIVVFHLAANIGFKKTIKDDATPKSLVVNK